MRFWITLVVSTVVISFGLTWLVMHQGQEVLPVLAPTSSAAEEPPIVVFELDKDQATEANGVEAKVAESVVGQEREAVVKLKNTGKGPLRLAWHEPPSCGCMELRIDGKAFGATSAPVIKKPGETATIALRWKAEQRHLINQPERGDSRFAVELKWNDPRFNANLRMEAVTRVVAPGGGKDK